MVVVGFLYRSVTEDLLVGTAPQTRASIEAQVALSASKVGPKQDLVYDRDATRTVALQSSLFELFVIFFALTTSSCLDSNLQKYL